MSSNYPCNIDGCNKPANQGKLCMKHWRIQKGCKATGCGNPYFRQGYCGRHYEMYGKSDKKCGGKGCVRKLYAKNYCRMHYARYIYNPKKKIRDGTKDRRIKTLCAEPYCIKKVLGYGNDLKGKYCGKHYARARKGLALNSPTRALFTHPLNLNWKGGIFDYENHALMRRIRKHKIEQTGGKCEDCGGTRPIMQIHHLDGSKNNHRIKNLKLLCPPCHSKYHPRNKYKDIICRYNGCQESAKVKYYCNNHYAQWVLNNETFPNERRAAGKGFCHWQNTFCQHRCNDTELCAKYNLPLIGMSRLPECKADNPQGIWI